MSARPLDMLYVWAYAIHMTTTAHRESILKIVGKGLTPEGHIPLFMAAELREMLLEGALERVEVTKPSKADASKTMTYAYVKRP